MSEYSYKDSGIQWLGEIPTHWKPMKLKKLIKLIPSNVDKRTEDDETPVKLCNYVDVYYNDVIDLSIEFMSATANDTELKRFQLIESDVIITKDSEDPHDIAVPAYVKETEDKLLCGYHLSILRNNSHELNNQFLFWALKDEKIASQLHREATGITRWAIGSKHVKNSIIALPPSKEQKAIADYLEKACAKIDRVIEMKKEQIEIIEKQYNSRIHEAITGENFGVSVFNDINSIDKHPLNWKVKKLKNIAWIKASSVDKKTEDNELPVKLCNYVDVYYNDIIDSTIDFMSATANEGEIKKFQLREGDVIITKDSEDPSDIAVPSFVKEAENGLLCGYHLTMIRCYEHMMIGEFLYWVLRDQQISDQFSCNATGITRWGVSSKNIKNVIIPVPPIAVQKQIISEMNSIRKNFSEVQRKLRSQVELLIKYKKSIIHECVTGKKKVFEGEPESLRAEAV